MKNSNIVISEVGKGIIAVDSVSTDSTGTLWNSSTYSTTEDPNNKIMLVSAADIDRRNQYWAAAIDNPKGHFITFVAPKVAFKHPWSFRKNKNSKEKVGIQLLNKLSNYNRKYNVRQINKTAVILARIFGQSLVIKIIQKNKFYLRVLPIFKEQIILSDVDNSVIRFEPIAAWGNSLKTLIVQPKDAVLYIHKPDPLGTGHTGISELMSLVRPLTYEVNMEYGYAKLMSQRGISGLHMKITGLDMGNPEALKQKVQQYEQLYGNIQRHNVYFTDENVDLSILGNATAGYDLNNVKEAFAKEAAAATGMGRSRIDGSERGMAMGNIADRDNFHDIINEIQEDNEQYLLEVYWKLIDPSLEGKFDIEWTAEVKLDELTKAQVNSMNASTANSVLDFMSYNQIREFFFKLDPVPNGDLIASVYIDKYLGGKEEMNENKKEEEEEPEDSIDPDIQDKKTEKLKELEKEPTPTELKKEAARALLEKGDSYRVVNEFLKDSFGSGLSFSHLVELRKEIDNLKKAQDSIDPQILSNLIEDILVKNPKISRDRARVLAIKRFLGVEQ